jgi:hypothetical protein
MIIFYSILSFITFYLHSLFPFLSFSTELFDDKEAIPFLKASINHKDRILKSCLLQNGLMRQPEAVQHKSPWADPALLLALTRGATAT